MCGVLLWQRGQIAVQAGATRRTAAGGRKCSCGQLTLEKLGECRAEVAEEQLSKGRWLWKLCCT